MHLKFIKSRFNNIKTFKSNYALNITVGLNSKLFTVFKESQHNRQEFFVKIQGTRIFLIGFLAFRNHAVVITLRATVHWIICCLYYLIISCIYCCNKKIAIHFESKFYHFQFFCTHNGLNINTSITHYQAAYKNRAVIRAQASGKQTVPRSGDDQQARWKEPFVKSWRYRNIYSQHLSAMHLDRRQACGIFLEHRYIDVYRARPEINFSVHR